jgi:hypothetical protein
MDPRPTDQWEQIFARLPAPNGLNSDAICAERVLGDIEGYQHPTGTENTRKRRQRVKDRDVTELSRAMIAFARMYYDAGVRP